MAYEVFPLRMDVVPGVEVLRQIGRVTRSLVSFFPETVQLHMSDHYRGPENTGGGPMLDRQLNGEHDGQTKLF